MEENLHHLFARLPPLRASPNRARVEDRPHALEVSSPGLPVPEICAFNEDAETAKPADWEIALIEVTEWTWRRHG
jgi:hypothetical protein